MSIKNKKGIPVTGSFKLIAPQPLDARMIVSDASELQSIIDENAAYKGLTVWVESTDTQVVFNGTEFVTNTIGADISGLGEYATKNFVTSNFVPKETVVGTAKVSIDSNINYGINILAQDSATTYIKAEFKKTGGVAWTARKGDDATTFTISHLGVKLNGANIATIPYLEDNFAPLVNGRVPSEYLPSYVDEIVEGYLIDGVFHNDYDGSVVEGHAGTIYVDIETNISYRYSESTDTYISIVSNSGGIDEETKEDIFTRIENIEGRFDEEGNALKAVSADKLTNSITVGDKSFNGLEDVDITLDDLGGVPSNSGDISISTKDGKFIINNKGSELTLSQDGLQVKTTEQNILNISNTGTTLDGSDILTETKVDGRFQPLSSTLTDIAAIHAEGSLVYKDNVWTTDTTKYATESDLTTYKNINDERISLAEANISTVDSEVVSVKNRVDNISLDTLTDADGKTVKDLVSDKVTLTDIQDKFISSEEGVDLQLDRTSHLFKAKDNLNNTSSVSVSPLKVTLRSQSGARTGLYYPYAELSLDSVYGLQYTVQPTDKASTTYKIATDESVRQAIQSYAGIVGGYPILDDNLKLPARYMPSSVDEIIEGTYDSTKGDFTTTDGTVLTRGEASKIYLDTSTNISYRWSGTQFSGISSSIALGYEATTAYPGNEGKANADNIQDIFSTLAEHEQEIGAIDDSIQEYKDVNERIAAINSRFTNNIANESAKVSHALTLNGYTKFDGTEDIVLTPDKINAVNASSTEGAYTNTITNSGAGIELKSVSNAGSTTTLLVNAVLGARLNGKNLATEEYVKTYAQPINDTLTNISNVDGTKGFLKLDTNGNWVLDNSEYATNNTVVDYAYALRDGEGSITYSELVQNYLTKEDADTKIDTAIKNRVEGTYATQTALDQLENNMQTYYATKASLDELAHIDGQPSADQIMVSAAASKTVKGSNKYIWNEITNSTSHVPTSNAVKSYVDSEVSKLSTSIIGAAPEELNTLQELAKALGDNANFSTTVLNKIATKAEASALDNTNNNVEQLEEDVKQLNISLDTTDEDVAALGSKIDSLNGDNIPISDTHNISIKEAIDSKLDSTEAEQTYYTIADAEDSLGDIEEVLDQINGNGTMDSLPAVYYPLVSTASSSEITKYVKFKDVVGGDFTNVVFLFVPNITSNYQFYEYGTGITASPNTFSVKAGHPVRISFTQVYGAAAGMFGVTYEYIDSNTGASQCTAYRNIFTSRLDSVCFQSNSEGMLIQISAINNSSSGGSSSGGSSVTNYIVETTLSEKGATLDGWYDVTIINGNSFVELAKYDIIQINFNYSAFGDCHVLVNTKIVNSDLNINIFTGAFSTQTLQIGNMNNQETYQYQGLDGLTALTFIGYKFS